MDNKKNTLSNQKRLIIIFVSLSVLLALIYLAARLIIKEPLQTVLKIDEKGDYVEAVVSDLTGQRGINITYLNRVLSGEEKNKYNVKKGETSDVLCTFNADNIQITYFPMVFPEVELSDIESLEVRNANGVFEVFTSDDGTAFIKGAEDNLYNNEQLASLLLQARYMLSNQRLDSAKDLSQYGLDEENAKAKVTLKTKKGESYTVYVGAPVAGGGYYMRCDGKDSVYIMDSTCQVFFNDVRSYLSPIITRAIPEQNRNYLEKFTYKKNGEPFFACEIIPDENRVGEYVNQLHKMTYPSKEYVLNTNNLYGMFSSLGSLYGISVMEYNVSELSSLEYKSCLSYYGFDKLIGEISYSLGAMDYTFEIGNTVIDEQTGEKYCYVYSPYMDTIVLLSLQQAPFIEYDLVDFIQAKVFQHNISDVSEIDVRGKSATRSFVLEETVTDGKKELIVTEKNSGKVVDTPSFRQFYISLLNVNLDGYSSIEAVKSVEELEHELTFDVTLKSGDRLTYSFYSESTLRCYMIVDGKGEFYTNREYIDKISKYADMLMSGETISSSY